MTNSQKRRGRKADRLEQRAEEIERMREIQAGVAGKFEPQPPSVTGCRKRRRLNLGALGQRSRRGYLV